MYLVKRPGILISISFAALLTLAACGGGSSSSTPATTTTTTTTTTTSATTAKITGSAKTTAKPSGKPGQNDGGQHFAAMAGATVTLWKIFPDGTETQDTSIGTVTTDSSGNFTLPAVTIPTTGTGAVTDYYYEVRITDGTNTEAYPLAPTGDMTIAATPNTTLAASVLADVVDNPSSTTDPTPPAATINQTATLVAANAADISTKTTLPTTTSTDATVIAVANGITTAGGAAEVTYKALQFESEYAGYAADLAAATAANVGGYLTRVARESCSEATSPLYQGTAELLAALFKDPTTYTPTAIVAAYNAVADNANQKVLATAVTDYTALLTAIEANPTTFTIAQQQALFTRHSLTAATFSATSALKVDQALSFLLSLGTSSSATAMNACQFQQANFSHVLASLTSHPSLASPMIVGYQIYNSAYTCPTDTNFEADDVRIYIPKSSTATVTGVTVASSDTSFNGGGAATLTLNGDRYAYVKPNSGAACVTLGIDTTYTITATLSSGGPLTKTVTRHHVLTPEPVDFKAGSTQMSNNENSPVTTTVARPLITWTAPATLYATITGAPAGSQVKYTIEFSHYRVGSGGPIASDTASCPGFNTGGVRHLYSVDNYLPAVDCNPTACLAAQIAAGAAGFTSSSVVECRMYINTWLVDSYDTLLGQAAGTFGFFKP